MSENKHSKHKKRWLIATAACFLIVGFYFTTTNAYTLLKGYAIYKWNKSETTEATAKHPEIKADTPDEDELYDTRPETGDLIGELYIPKLEATLPIYHGTNEDELEKGVGHFAESVLPGEMDNSVLSGHRDTIFRKLGEVGKGDLLITKTEAGTFTYKVRKVRIVDADDRTVIVPKPKSTLTVTTCYPFSYIGNAPERYVLIADLLKSEIDN
ncbi:class D sortase [Peribacillus butanolivorans]|uniref:Class D sortase n=1 Tax=Peribacillus butanolivorans TaxID=421767 RepID=A0AAX0RR37_9BACI|nr:class D sortase [Peribacillus butanolivorans]AXN38723.1 class D sortase [Peribacillus butanolivorans]PEJ30274.1 class D sortase [Peribacillus butanolivorans]